MSIFWGFSSFIANSEFHMKLHSADKTGSLIVCRPNISVKLRNYSLLQTKDVHERRFYFVQEIKTYNSYHSFPYIYFSGWAFILLGLPLLSEVIGCFYLLSCIMEDPRHQNLSFSPPVKCCEIWSLVQFFCVIHSVSFSLWNFLEQCRTQHTVPHSTSALFKYTFKVVFICSEINKNLGKSLKKMERKKICQVGILPCCSCSPVQRRRTLGAISTFHSLPLTLFCLKYLLGWRHSGRVVIKAAAC